MYRIIRALLDTVFPPSPDELLIRSLTEARLMTLARVSVISGVIALFSYRNPTIRTLIWQLKYKDDYRPAVLFGGALARYMQKENLVPALILPIPLSKARMRERGYNQVSRCAAELTRILPTSLCRNDLLVRTHDNPRQTTLNRKDRIHNMRDMFMIADPRALKGHRVIILDDVVTTGATLAEAAKVVRACGAHSVTLIALAH